MLNLLVIISNDNKICSHVESTTKDILKDGYLTRDKIISS